jgi:multiple sugar transport system permease protein
MSPDHSGSGLFNNIAEENRMGYNINRKKREEITGYLFIAPTYLFYIAFLLLPLCFTIYFSFTEYNVLKPPNWVGFSNYIQIFKDKTMAKVTANTIIYAVCTTIFKTTIALIFALILNNKYLYRWVRNTARVSIFFPYLVAMSYVALIWSFMFSKDMGVVNYYLNRFGISPLPWFTDTRYALSMLIGLDVWKHMGYAMLIYLAGLQGISNEYYEAGIIDGANRWQLIKHITLPLLRPTTIMLVILHTIYGLQAFDSMSVITQGGPGNSTRSVLLYIYDKAFKSYDMGYSSALSVLMIIVIFIISIVQLKFDKNPEDA